MAGLKGKTIIITGASRGIGRAIALRAASDGANIVIAAKSAEPHPKLKGSIFETAAEVEAAGGQALPLKIDVRFEDQVVALMTQTMDRFGAIDALVNNAGAISLTPVEKTSLKRYDLMQNINARAVFLCSQAALPHLKKAPQPHILSLCPPIDPDVKWLAGHAPYTLSKYGMTLLSLGMAAEFQNYGIAVNCLWPQTIIATAAIEFAVGDRKMLQHARTPQIMADAAHAILATKDLQLTGRCLIDETLLRDRGVTDFSAYARDPSKANALLPDLFVAPS